MKPSKTIMAFLFIWQILPNHRQAPSLQHGRVEIYLASEVASWLLPLEEPKSSHAKFRQSLALIQMVSWMHQDTSLASFGKFCSYQMASRASKQAKLFPELGKHIINIKKQIFKTPNRCITISNNIDKRHINLYYSLQNLNLYAEEEDNIWVHLLVWSYRKIPSYEQVFPLNGQLNDTTFLDRKRLENRLEQKLATNTMLLREFNLLLRGGSDSQYEWESLHRGPIEPFHKQEITLKGNETKTLPPIEFKDKSIMTFRALGHDRECISVYKKNSNNRTLQEQKTETCSAKFEWIDPYNTKYIFDVRNLKNRQTRIIITDH